jgi:hypothetical protein
MGSAVFRTEQEYLSKRPEGARNNFLGGRNI